MLAITVNEFSSYLAGVFGKFEDGGGGEVGSRPVVKKHAVSQRILHKMLYIYCIDNME